jgi:hypothetical protein
MPAKSVLNKLARQEDVEQFPAPHLIARTKNFAQTPVLIVRVAVIALRVIVRSVVITPPVLQVMYVQLRIVRDRDVKHRPVPLPQTVTIPISVFQLA